MTAIWKHVVALTAFVALLWASPTAAGAGQNDPPAGMTVSLVKNGQAMGVKAMLLYAGSKPKGADLTANVGTFKQEDVEDRRRGAVLFLDEHPDGSADVSIVLDGVAHPPAAAGTTRRNLGPVIVYRGARLAVDAGAGRAVTDASQEVAPSTRPTTAGEPNLEAPAGYRTLPRFYVGLAGGYSQALSSLGFCDDNATRLRTVNAVQSSCGYDTSSVAYNASFGLRFARIGGWNLLGAGGYATFGRTRPEALGTAQTFTVTRIAREKFRGGWAGVGARRHWSSWSFQPTLGVAYLRRDTDTTDTFTRLADRLVVENAISRRDNDVQPIVAISVYRRAGSFFYFGTTYTVTRFKDDLKTQSLHGIQAGLQIAFGS
jgi:hypothetical protein